MDDRLKAALQARGLRGLVQDAARAEAAETRYRAALVKAILAEQAPGAMLSVLGGYQSRTFWVDLHTEYSRVAAGASRTTPALFTRTDRGIVVFRPQDPNWQSLGAVYPTEADWTVLHEFGPRLVVGGHAGMDYRSGLTPAAKRQARAYGRQLARELYGKVTGPVAVLLDVSGSTDKHARAFQGGFCDELARHATVSVSMFDTQATELAHWTRKAAETLDTAGGGGTDLTAALEATAAARGAMPTIVVTDGDLAWPATLPASVSVLVVNDRVPGRSMPPIPTRNGVTRRPAAPIRGGTGPDLAA